MDPKVFERLALFYLGRATDTPDTPLLMDAQSLTTHAMCVGMTGSGKTGLGVGMLEEAAMDRIPAIIIDPKGDLSNLFLTFEQLDGPSFEPWVDTDAALRAGETPETFAASEAHRWTEGLAEWGQDADRIRRLRQSVRYRLFTPGSTSGEPISILSALKHPGTDTLADPERRGLALEGAADSLLGLFDIPEADADRGRVLLSGILDAVWTEGRDLDLPELVNQIQHPPFEALGVLPLETYYPQADRTRLAMAVNHLLASPTFAGWLNGDPLDIDRLLYAPDGTPQHAVISLAHLSDRERMFFVSLVLHRLVLWVRAQRGTSSLRALLYMDEVFGYVPPVAEPPSKRAMLTLLKQARAYGLGVVLATQNPGDLDYKALANLGTWFIGRLTAERDRQKLLDGLRGSELDARRGTIAEHLARLAKRHFVMASVHHPEPVTFETRWAMAYLRGPLTANDHALLYDQGLLTRPTTPATSVSHDPAPTDAPVATPAAPTPSTASITSKLPSDIPALFTAEAASTLYPHLWVQMDVVFENKARTSTDAQSFSVAVPMEDAVVPLRWDGAVILDQLGTDFLTTPQPGTTLTPIPEAASVAKNYTAWRNDAVDWVYRTHELEVVSHPSTGLQADPGEAERDFLIRLRHELHEARDREIQKIERTYETRTRQATRKLETAQRALDREESQASESKRQAAISTGGALLGMLLGRKKVSVGNIGRASSAVRGASRSKRQAEDVKREEARIRDLELELDTLATDLEAELAEVSARYTVDENALTSTTLRPLKKNIRSLAVGVVWLP